MNVLLLLIGGAGVGLGYLVWGRELRRVQRDAKLTEWAADLLHEADGLIDAKADIWFHGEKGYIKWLEAFRDS